MHFKLDQVVDRLNRLKPPSKRIKECVHGAELDMSGYSPHTKRLFSWWWAHWLALPDARTPQAAGILSRLTAYTNDVFMLPSESRRKLGRIALHKSHKSSSRLQGLCELSVGWAILRGRDGQYPDDEPDDVVLRAIMHLRNARTLLHHANGDEMYLFKTLMQLTVTYAERRHIDGSMAEAFKFSNEAEYLLERMWTFGSDKCSDKRYRTGIHGFAFRTKGWRDLCIHYSLQLASTVYFYLDDIDRATAMYGRLAGRVRSLCHDTHPANIVAHKLYAGALVRQHRMEEAIPMYRLVRDWNRESRLLCVGCEDGIILQNIITCLASARRWQEIVDEAEASDLHLHLIEGSVCCIILAQVRTAYAWLGRNDDILKMCYRFDEMHDEKCGRAGALNIRAQQDKWAALLRLNRPEDAALVARDIIHRVSLIQSRPMPGVAGGGGGGSSSSSSSSTTTTTSLYGDHNNNGDGASLDGSDTSSSIGDADLPSHFATTLNFDDFTGNDLGDLVHDGDTEDDISDGEDNVGENNNFDGEEGGPVFQPAYLYIPHPYHHPHDHLNHHHHHHHHHHPAVGMGDESALLHGHMFSPYLGASLDRMSGEILRWRNLRAHWDLAWSLSECNKLDEASYHLRRCLSFLSCKRPSIEESTMMRNVLCQLAWLYELQGKFEDAAVAFAHAQRTLAHRPYTPAAAGWYAWHRAKMFLYQGRMDEALQNFMFTKSSLVYMFGHGATREPYDAEDAFAPRPRKRVREDGGVDGDCIGPVAMSPNPGSTIDSDNMLGISRFGMHRASSDAIMSPRPLEPLPRRRTSLVTVYTNVAASISLPSLTLQSPGSTHNSSFTLTPSLIGSSPALGARSPMSFVPFAPSPPTSPHMLSRDAAFGAEIAWAASQPDANKKIPILEQGLHLETILRPPIEPVHMVGDPLLTMGMPLPSQLAFFSHDTERTVRDWLADNARWPLSAGDAGNGAKIDTGDCDGDGPVPRLRPVSSLGYDEFVRQRRDEQWREFYEQRTRG